MESETVQALFGCALGVVLICIVETIGLPLFLLAVLALLICYSYVTVKMQQMQMDHVNEVPQMQMDRVNEVPQIQMDRVNEVQQMQMDRVNEVQQMQMDRVNEVPQQNEYYVWKNWSLLRLGQKCFLWNENIIIELDGTSPGWTRYMLREELLQIVTMEKQGYQLVNVKTKREFLTSVEEAKNLAGQREAMPLTVFRIGNWILSSTPDFVTIPNEESPEIELYFDDDFNGFIYQASDKSRWITSADDSLKSYNCPCFAPYSTDDNFSMNRHQKQHMEFKPWRCALCGQRFPEEWKLRRHLLSRKHSVDEDIVDFFLEGAYVQEEEDEYGPTTSAPECSAAADARTTTRSSTEPGTSAASEARTTTRATTAPGTSTAAEARTTTPATTAPGTSTAAEARTTTRATTAPGTSTAAEARTTTRATTAPGTTTAAARVPRM